MNSKQILDILDLEVIVIDPHTYEIKFANQTFLDKHGIQDLTGKRCYEVTHQLNEPCTFPNNICPLASTLHHKEKAATVHIHFDKRGNRYAVEVSTIPILSADGTVTSVIHTARNVGNHQEQLQLLEQRAAVGVMASAVGHEINNYLAVFKGCIDLLKIKAAHENQSYMIERMRLSIDNMEKVANDLMSLGKPKTMALELCDLNSLIRKTIEDLVLWGLLKHLEINFDLDGAIPPIYISSDHIKQVILNLCLNLVHSMEESVQKRVTIGTQLSADSKNVCFWVSDTGCGIPEDRLDRIFEPFYTTKGEKGTGLGLLVVKSIVADHGGRIEVESKVGKGTTFKIFLPLRVDENST